MRLTELQIDILEFPPHARYKNGVIPPGRPQTWQFPLLTFRADNGLEGHSMIYGPHGDGPAMADILAKTYWPMLKGQDPRETESLWRQLMRKQRDLYNLSHALTGVIDVALWDLRAKSLDLPLHRLLGSVRQSMPCYASCRSVDHSPEEFAEEALALKAQGFHGYKIQVFGGDPQHDAACLRAVRQAVGDGFPVMLDMNSQYTLADAHLFGQTADELHAFWLEEPCDESNLHAYQVLAQRLRTPILAGETSRLQEMRNFLAAGALGYARGDVLIKGGITGLLKLGHACELFGYRLEIHTTNTPVLDVANFHLACHLKNTTFIENHHPIFRFALANNPMEIDPQGMIHIPNTPGLGITLDQEWIQSHTSASQTVR